MIVVMDRRQAPPLHGTGRDLSICFFMTPLTPPTNPSHSGPIAPVPSYHPAQSQATPIPSGHPCIQSQATPMPTAHPYLPQVIADQFLGTPGTDQYLGSSIPQIPQGNPAPLQQHDLRPLPGDMNHHRYTETPMTFDPGAGHFPISGEMGVVYPATGDIGHHPYPDNVELQPPVFTQHHDGRHLHQHRGFIHSK